jgi:adenosylcobinamide-GDP ribazoletransferase
MAVVLRVVPYVGGGLGSAFTGSRAVVGVVGLLVAAVVAPPEVVALTVAAAGVVLLGRRRLGGVTGDVLGAAGVVGETVGLLVATASW